MCMLRGRVSSAQACGLTPTMRKAYLLHCPAVFYGRFDVDATLMARTAAFRGSHLGGLPSRMSWCAHGYGLATVL